MCEGLFSAVLELKIFDMRKLNEFELHIWINYKQMFKIMYKVSIFEHYKNDSEALLIVRDEILHDASLELLRVGEEGFCGKGVLFSLTNGHILAFEERKCNMMPCYTLARQITTKG